MTDLRALLTRAGEALELALKTPRNAWEFRDAGLVYTREVMLRALHAEITAALADAPDDGWRDIASAPKDGTFYVWAPDEAVRKPYSSGHSNTAIMVRLSSVSLIDAHFHWDMPTPTHWRPLPPPPAERKE